MDAKENEFRVVYHALARSMMNAAVDELLNAGWTKGELRRLASEFEDLLREDPHRFGEPHYSIHVLKLKIHVGFVGPLSIQIGIQDEQRIVLVRKVILMRTKKD